MDTTHDVVRGEVMAQADGLGSRVSSDRIASLRRVIAVGLAAGVTVDDIRDGIARQLGALLAGSREKAPIAWSDASERDFCNAFEEVLKANPRQRRRILVPDAVEDRV